MIPSNCVMTPPRGCELCRVAKTIMHPGYDPATRAHNIAIIKLSSPFELSSKIMPIDIAEQGEELPVGMEGFLSGYGAVTDLSFVQPLRSYRVDVPKVSQADCRSSYGNSAIPDDMICYGQIEGGKDSCVGESGGPLVVKGKATGITSWGFGCGQSGGPGVYTRLSNYNTWIRSSS